MRKETPIVAAFILIAVIGGSMIAKRWDKLITDSRPAHLMESGPGPMKVWLRGKSRHWREKDGCSTSGESTMVCAKPLKAIGWVGCAKGRAGCETIF